MLCEDAWADMSAKSVTVGENESLAKETTNRSRHNGSKG